MAKAKVTQQKEVTLASVEAKLAKLEDFQELTRVAEEITGQSGIIADAKAERESYSDELFRHCKALSAKKYSAVEIFAALWNSLGYSKENKCNDSTLKAYRSAMQSVEDGSSKKLVELGKPAKAIADFASFADLRNYIYPKATKAVNAKAHPVIDALAQLLATAQPEQAEVLAEKLNAILKDATAKPAVETKPVAVKKAKAPAAVTEKKEETVVAKQEKPVAPKKSRKASPKKPIAAEQVSAEVPTLDVDDEQDVSKEIASIFAALGMTGNEGMAAH